MWAITGAKISDLTTRSWRFIPSNHLLARINDDGRAYIYLHTSVKFDITIIKPSTMTLTNVDMMYDRTYSFVVDVGLNRYASYVDVSILGECIFCHFVRVPL